MLVTVFGASGFIGQNVVNRLGTLDLRVRATDIRPMAIATPNNTEFISADILDDQHVSELVEGADVIVHLAVSNLRTSLRNPKRNVKINVQGTLNIFDAARKANVRKVIYPSASSTYGTPRYMPVDEEHPKYPTTVYGVTKYMGEHLLRVYQELYGLSYFVFRFTNVYGPYQGPDTGGLVPATMARIVNQEPVTIYGDGSQTRDFVYVGDLADLIQRVVIDDTLKNRVVNAGSGVQTSIADVVQACGRVLGVQPRITHKPQEGGERGLFEADMTLCRTLFGGLPSTPLEDGLRRTAAWFTETFAARVPHA
jgi:UDP-glucose 4-epimerase